MAELIILAFQPGISLLHRLDARSKLILLVLLDLIALSVSPLRLFPITALLLVLGIIQKLPFFMLLRQTRLFYLMLLFVLLARSITTPGFEILTVASFSMTQEGIHSGAIYCWRLLLVLYFGILFIRTTKILDIKAAIQWFLKPLPWVPEKRLAMMISLMLRFLPLILEKSGTISDAQKARGIEQIRNPLRRLRLFSVALLSAVFKTADQLAIAMEARSYSENRSDPILNFQAIDGVVLVAGSISGVVLMVL